MTATDLVQYLTWIIYVTIFLVVCVQYVRRPRRANLNIALFFGIITFIIADQVLASFEIFPFPSLLNAINVVLLFTLPYVLLRLVDDFVGVRPAVMRTVVIWFVLVSIASFVFRPPPGWVTIIEVLYFVGLQIYAGYAFTQASRHASGVTKRRLGVVALGRSAWDCRSSLSAFVRSTPYGALFSRGLHWRQVFATFWDLPRLRFYAVPGKNRSCEHF